MTKRRPSKPPAGLTRESSDLWRAIIADFDFGSDAAGLALLLSLCQTLDRLRECQSAIKKDGLTVDGSNGQPRAHPLLAVESEAKRALLAHFRALRLQPEDY